MTPKKICILNIFIILVGLVVWQINYSKFGGGVVLMIIVVLVALITFFGILDLGLNMNGEMAIEKSGMRTAITAAFLTMYLVLVGIVTFLSKGPTNLLPVTEEMLSSFTTIVGIVVASYFGSSAYIHGQQIKGQKKQE